MREYLVMDSLNNDAEYSVAGLILAGGEGRRVGCQNKGFLVLQDKPLIQHVFERLSPQVDAILISANQDIDRYQQFTENVVTDDLPFLGKGPLSGILSAKSLYLNKTDLLQVVPCDTPFIPTHLVAALKQSLLSDSRYDIAYAATPSHDHPAIFLCKTSINKDLAEHLAIGSYSLKSWIFKHNAVKVLFEDENAFTNINHLETLQKHQDLLC